MLILLGLIAALTATELSSGFVLIALAPIAKHVARSVSGVLAERAPAAHVSLVMALHAARFRLNRMRGLRSTVHARLLCGPLPGEPGEWDAARLPPVEALLRAETVNCDIKCLQFRDPSVRVRLPVSSIAPALGMRDNDILELHGLDHRGFPWARVYRTGDDIDLPPRVPDPTPPKPAAAREEGGGAASRVSLVRDANVTLIKDGQILADVTKIACIWGPDDVEALTRIAPFAVRDAVIENENVREACFSGGHSTECQPDAVVLTLRALAWDVETTDFVVATVAIQHKDMYC